MNADQPPKLSEKSIGPEITVIVPVKDKAHVLAQSIRSILSAVDCKEQAELIVIDHGSTDGSSDILQASGAARFVVQYRGGTIASARNFGASHANGEVFLFLDCDIEVPVDYLTRVHDAFDRSGSAIVGAQVDLPDTPTWVEATWHRLTVDRRSGTRHFINSGNIAVRREAFAAIGGFPSDFITGEDWEFCRRATKNGFELYQDECLIAKHLDNPKTIGAFFRKEVWYGLGMLRASDKYRLNLTTVATLYFAASLGCTVAGITMANPPVTAIGMFSIAVILILTLLYRYRRTRQAVPVIPAIFLLIVFYLARFYGLARSLLLPRP